MSARFAPLVRALVLLLREWNGDAAYERYLASTQGPRMSRGAFYLDSLRRRYHGPTRCC